MDVRRLPLWLAVVCFCSATFAYGPVPPTVPANDSYAAAGYLKATLYPGVDPTGTADSTNGLRAALADGYNYGLAVLLPAGTYLVSDTLLQDQKWERVGCSEQLRFTRNMINKSPILVGEPGAQRPVIRLRNSSAGFNDPANPKPVVYFRNVKDGVTGWQANLTCGFGFVFRGIDINLGSGNAGAVGLMMPSAQYSTIEDTKITATGAFAGVMGTPSTNVVVNVEVDGGQYGIRPEVCCGISLVGIKLRNQTVAALRLDNYGATMVTGFDIQVSGSAIPIQNTYYTSQTSEAALLDGVITITGGGTQAAIYNPNRHTLWASNVYVTSAGPIVQSGSATVPGGGTKRIDEYSYTNPRREENAGFLHDSYTLINGETGQAPIIDVEDAGAIPADLVSRHVFGVIPWFNNAGVADVTKAPYLAVGDGETDSTAAIQAAINQSDYVYLPRGDYVISGTLTLRPNTHLFGTSGMRSRLFAQNWNPAGQLQPFIRTADDATATTYLGDININLPPGFDKSYLEGLDWRAGRNSIVRQAGVRAAVEFCPEGSPASTCFSSAPRKFVRVRNNGGGRWYGLQMFQDSARVYNAALRGIDIAGTTQPLTFYGPNPEHQNPYPFVEIGGARNVRILGTKTENLSWLINNSSNVLFAAHTGNDDVYPMVQISGSQNVVVPVLSEFSGKGNASSPILSETYQGNTFTVAGDDRVSLFKRGTFDATVFEGVGTVPGRLTACSASRTITIDGNTSDWSGIPAISVPYTKAVSSGGGTPASDADSSATFRAQWNGTNLYVLVEARDDAVVGTSTGVYNNDGAELYLNGGNEAATTYDANDFQLTVDWQGRKGGVNSNLVTFAAAAAVAAQGYTVEYAVPWTALGGVAGAGRVIGFDVGVNDNDAADTVRDSQIVWRGNGTGWQDPSQFDKLELRATACP